VKLDGEYALDVLYREVSAEMLQTELDTCWVNVGGENPSDYVRKYTGRAPIVHLKDFTGSKSENMYALIGTDTAKAESYAKLLYAQACLMADLPIDDPVEYTKLVCELMK
jgi:sugar phosphate isomerase/epimerase